MGARGACGQGRGGWDLPTTYAHRTQRRPAMPIALHGGLYQTPPWACTQTANGERRNRLRLRHGCFRRPARPARALTPPSYPGDLSFSAATDVKKIIPRTRLCFRVLSNNNAYAHKCTMQWKGWNRQANPAPRRVSAATAHCAMHEEIPFLLTCDPHHHHHHFYTNNAAVRILPCDRAPDHTPYPFRELEIRCADWALSLRCTLTRSLAGSRARRGVIILSATWASSCSDPDPGHYQTSTRQLLTCWCADPV